MLWIITSDVQCWKYLLRNRSVNPITISRGNFSRPDKIQFWKVVLHSVITLCKWNYIPYLQYFIPYIQTYRVTHAGLLFVYLFLITGLVWYCKRWINKNMIEKGCINQIPLVAKNAEVLNPCQLITVVATKYLREGDY